MAGPSTNKRMRLSWFIKIGLLKKQIWDKLA